MQVIFNIVEREALIGIIAILFFIYSVTMFIKLMYTFKLDNYEKLLMTEHSKTQHEYWLGVKTSFFLSYIINSIANNIKLTNDSSISSESIFGIIMVWLLIFITWALFLMSKDFYYSLVKNKYKKDYYIEMEADKSFKIIKKMNNGLFLIEEITELNSERRIVDKEHFLNKTIKIKNNTLD
ncbi:hypothetical protein ACKXGF_02815 [Alkalibacillus sp. S2W]|uniref:hypothetical protein n=1 Tax=Alkalibacillus sp. S2W TaxID=3386553 RepID=UPI00398C8541